MRGLVVGALFPAAIVTALSSCFYDVPPLADMIVDAGDRDAPSSGDGGACACVPAGWSLAVFHPDMQPACPSGTLRDWITNPVGPPATCACTCNPAPAVAPTCSTNNLSFSITFGTNAQCTGGSSSSLTSGTTCTIDTASFSTGNQPLNFAKASANIPLVGGTCAAGVPTQNVTPPSFSKGRSCDMALTASCDAGACAPMAPPPFRTCISKPGDIACPASWPTKSLAGDAVTDTRGCGPSACNCSIGGSCSAPNLHLYSNNGCSAQLVVFPADGTCQNAATNVTAFTVQSSRIGSSSPNATCSGPQNFGPTGALAMTNATTFCCL